MVAVALALGLFVFWFVVGYSIVSALRSPRNTLQNLLLAPAVGVTASVLPVFELNRAGWPVSRFGFLLLVGLCALSALLLWWRRPVFPLRRFAPFVAVLALAFFASGWPLFVYGFDWLSYANDDFGNYVLGASRFFNYGYFDVPDMATLTNGQDYSLYYWFLHVPGQIRPGSELMIAWVMSFTHLSGYQVFMPVILALLLVLVSSAGAMVCRGRTSRAIALLACALLSLSALTTLGVIFQLIGQVGGLALLAASATLVFDSTTTTKARLVPIVRSGALLAIVVAGLLVWYPEVVPFLGVGWVLHTGAMVLRRRFPTRARLATLVGGVLVGEAILGTYSVSALVFLLQQIETAQRPTDPIAPIFPYFLVPTGLAYLWGFANIATLPVDPWLTLGILLGAALLLGSALAAAVLTWRGHPVGALTLGMGALSIRLFSQHIDFGLFKLAMFAQPFLLATLAIVVVAIARRRTWRAALPAAVVLFGVPAQQAYVYHASWDDSTVQVPFASSSRLATELELATTSPAGRTVIDTANSALAKLEASRLIGSALDIPSREFFLNIISYARTPDPTNHALLPLAIEIQQRVQAQYVTTSFPVLPADGSALEDRFTVDTLGQPAGSALDCDVLIASSGNQDVFNRMAQTAGTALNFDVRPCDSFRNHLIFVDSELGEHYPPADPHLMSVFQLEPDILFPGHTMAGIGRYLLMEVLNPANPVRLELNITATLKADRENFVPPAALVGESRQLFSAEGRGSARLFSPPVTTRQIGGRSYLLLDMGVDGTHFPDYRSGVMNLFGTGVPLDSRSLVAFARDVSLISDSDYQQLQTPAALSNLPADLSNPNFEYSGIYEDGWVAESSFVDLIQRSPHDDLDIRGVIPYITQRVDSTIQVTVDGVPRLEQNIGAADFQLRLPSLPVGRHRIGLQFSAIQRLPSPDNRPVAALVHFIGFETPVAPPAGDVVAAGSSIRLGNNWYPLEVFGGQTFRWVDNDAEIIVPPGDGQTHNLSLDLEPGPSMGSPEMSVSLLDQDGATIQHVDVQDRQSITLSVPPMTTTLDSVLRLHVTSPDVAAQNDPRILNLRVFSATWC
jgi:hypothetical protein